MSATEARIHFGEVLRRVSEEGDVIRVERSGKPLAVVISIAEYEDLERLRRERRPETDWWELAQRSREIMRKRFEGRTPPDINKIFDEMRAERDEQLLAGIVPAEALRQRHESESNDG
jgi:prevent-host-death family protein